MRRDRERKLDLADIGGETDAAAHAPTIAQPCLGPKGLDAKERSCDLGKPKGNEGIPGNPREIITTAERRFPVRIRISVAPAGFGQRHTAITAWLDDNCGSDGWAMTPSGMRGVLNDAVSIYFREATLGSAFVARWCAASKVDADGGVFRLRDDEPAPRIGAGPHQTP